MYKIGLICLLVLGLISCNTNQVDKLNNSFIKTNVDIIDMTESEKIVNDIVPIHGTNPENINDYNDVLELFKNNYYEYTTTEGWAGWENIISHLDKYYYSLFDFDNNGIDEIVVYNNNNQILYMFTMNNGIPFCLIDSVGYHEIGYWTYYRLIGDYIIEKHTDANIDFDEYSYCLLNDNKLVLIDKIFNGYIENDNGTYERKIIYTKDGVEREIDDVEEETILGKYNLIYPNTRKTIELIYDIE